MTIAALAWPGVSRAEPVDGLELVNTYRDIIEDYRRHDPAHSAEGYAVVVKMSRWDPDLAECLRLYGNEEGWHRELLT